MNEYKHDQVRGHTFDGIEEFDNRLPDWWLWILYGSIIFSIGYWVAFHTLSVVPHPEGRYAMEMQAAAEAQLARMSAGGTTNSSLNMMVTLDDRVATGRQLFENYCVVCHAARGQGKVGPNLTDDHWIHGGQPVDIHDVITNGVLDKGMAAWGKQLGPTRVNELVAYVLSIRNTSVEGKAVQGDLYELTVEQENAADEQPAPDG